MAEPLPAPDPGPGTDPEPAVEDEATTGPPRWVKVFGIIALLVAVAVVVVLLIGGGHGPGRHTASGTGTHPPIATMASAGAASFGWVDLES